MYTALRAIIALSYAIVAWVFVSVAGAFFDPTHAELWSASLMWSFLATLLVAPALVLIFDASSHRARPRRSAAARAPGAASEAQSRADRETFSSRTTRATSQRAFVEDASAAYPVPEELGARQESPAGGERADGGGAHAA